MVRREGWSSGRVGVHEVWQTCSVNCGSRCALRLQVRDGEILWTDTDCRPEEPGNPQLRACLRGRALRYWLGSSDRLNEPLRRVGPRGSGRFEPIGWDEALDEIAERIRDTVARWGNEAVLLPYATAIWSGSGSPFERLMNCYGGHLGIYGDYSCMQLQTACTSLFGDDGYYTGSLLSEASRADLVVLFGANPALTRMGGASGAYRLVQTREAAEGEGRPFKVIAIDPCQSDAVTGDGDAWIPLRPGTDAAFVAGVAWVLITEGHTDEEFLHRYCVGYDGATMPAGVPASESYRAYVLGEGPDGVAKTPQWAARITGCPSARIVSFARELAGAKRAFIMQGWGPQRTAFGEQSARAICLLALLTGNFGLPGTNSGARERLFRPVLPDDPVGENPVKAAIPVFLWSRAVERGSELAASDGVRGVDRLPSPVKLIINHAGNALTNQHADINRTHEILADESLCEFIVGIDVMMTDSMRYADIVLPDVAQAERDVLVSSGNSDGVCGVISAASWGGDALDRRCAWEVARELARRLGVEEAFCEGVATLGEMDELRLRESCFADDAEGVRAELAEQGVVRRPYEGEAVAYADFRRDPEAHPLPTPSGKVEIYDQKVAELLADDPSLPASPIPAYIAAPEGAEAALAGPYPFQMISYHGRQSAHSSFSNVPELAVVVPRRLSVNPVDAERLQIASGALVVVENDRGALVCRARVTPRIMPGVVALPEGAWHDADMQGDRLDWGGCANTVSSDEPTAWSHGNPHNSCLVRLRHLTDAERAEAALREAEAGRGEEAR